MDINGDIEGHGKDTAGAFTIHGKMQDDWLTFKKQYSGLEVMYKGQCLDLLDLEIVEGF